MKMMYTEMRVEDMPEGCRACGGDYPNCKDSCPLYDSDDD